MLHTFETVLISFPGRLSNLLWARSNTTWRVLILKWTRREFLFSPPFLSKPLPSVILIHSPLFASCLTDTNLPQMNSNTLISNCKVACLFKIDLWNTTRTSIIYKLICSMFLKTQMRGTLVQLCIQNPLQGCFISGQISGESQTNTGWWIRLFPCIGI